MSRPARNPNREFEELISDLSARLDHLKAMYEQWFQGFERLPPVKLRDKLERDLKAARRRQPLNTALKFKFQTLWQRWNTLSTHWARVTRQIEEGTYYRDVQRMKRRRKRRDQRQQKAAAAMEIDVDLENFDLEAEIGAAMDALQMPGPEPLPEEKTEPNITLPGAMSASPPAPPPAALKQARKLSRHEDAISSMPPPVPKAAAKRVSKGAMAAAASLPPPVPKSAKPAAPKPAVPKPAKKKRSGPSDAEMRAIYDEYVKARRKNKERVDNLQYEKLAKQIRQTVPKLQEKHKGKKIGFEVVVRNGRVGLKPVTKE